MRPRLLAVPVAALALVLLSGCATNPAGSSPTPTTPAATAAAPSESPTADSGCGYTESPGGVREVNAPPAEPTVSGTVTAKLTTSAGDITIAMDADRTPCTVGSFASLAEQKFYDDTTCHRITTSGIFILQCGDPSATGTGGPGYRYADELDGTETYPAGTVAMANAGPDTNGSQFFFVYEDTQLSPAYTVFGTVDDASLKVLQAIAAKGQEGNDPNGGAPKETVTIKTVTIG